MSDTVKAPVEEEKRLQAEIAQQLLTPKRVQNFSINVFFFYYCKSMFLPCRMKTSLIIALIQARAATPKVLPAPEVHLGLWVLLGLR